MNSVESTELVKYFCKKNEFQTQNLLQRDRDDTTVP